MSAGADPTVRALVARLLMPSFSGTSPPTWLRRRVDEGLGGICLFGQNVARDPAQVRALVDALRGDRPDLIVASDEEGGEVTRLERHHGSSWPAPAALGVVDDLDATRTVGAGIGAMCSEAGIDLALAPSVDVNSNPDNPIIGLRSFGADVGTVVRHARAFVTGVHSAGVLTCAKHYPGHGDTALDSHLALPIVQVSVQEALERELAPFAALVEAGVPAIMTAHVAFPALDPALLDGMPTPATLSAPILRLLRDDLGYDSAILTDALDMRAISAGVGRARGAVLALRAGADLVCIGNPAYPARYDPQEVLEGIEQAILQALDDGGLTRERVEEAAARMNELAMRRADLAALAEPVGDAHQVASDVARRAMRHSGPVSGALTMGARVIDLRVAPTVATADRQSGVMAALLETSGGAARDGAGTVVVVSAPYRIAAERERLRAALKEYPDAVVVATGLPDARADLGTRWVTCHGDSAVSGRAVADLLRGG